ncbi:MAG: FCD domain-containing protein [Pseudomonadales bacterium]
MKDAATFTLDLLIKQLETDIAQETLDSSAPLNAAVLSGLYRCSQSQAREALNALSHRRLLTGGPDNFRICDDNALQDYTAQLERRCTLECHALAESINNASAHWFAALARHHHLLVEAMPLLERCEREQQLAWIDASEAFHSLFFGACEDLSLSREHHQLYRTTSALLARKLRDDESKKNLYYNNVEMIVKNLFRSDYTSNCNPLTALYSNLLAR